MKTQPQETKIKLEPTAAFVVQAAQEYFSSDPLLKQYFNCLNLATAADLASDFKEAGILDILSSHLAYRKFAIRKLLFDAIEKTTGKCQILILAAGKSPLGMEVAGRSHSNVSRIFEVDITPFSEKEAIYKKFLGQKVDQVSFLSTDILSPTLMGNLKKIGFSPDLKTFVILEGITFYISTTDLFNLIGYFRTPKRSNSLIIEYGRSFETIEPNTLKVAKIVFDRFEGRYFRSGMIRYDGAQLGRQLEESGGKVIRRVSPTEMEVIARNENQYFSEKNSGWIEVTFANI